MRVRVGGVHRLTIITYYLYIFKKIKFIEKKRKFHSFSLKINALFPFYLLLLNIFFSYTVVKFNKLWGLRRVGSSCCICIIMFYVYVSFLILCVHFYLWLSGYCFVAGEGGDEGQWSFEGSDKRNGIVWVDKRLSCFASLLLHSMFALSFTCTSICLCVCVFAFQRLRFDWSVIN